RRYSLRRPRSRARASSRAEPATDLALFRASFKQHAMRRGPSPAQSFDILSKLDELCDRFYERAAPVSRERVAPWETLYLLENVLKPGRRSDRSTCRSRGSLRASSPAEPPATRVIPPVRLERAA